jgi:diguanylate cyclase (GGDEF)-like protein
MQYVTTNASQQLPSGWAALFERSSDGMLLIDDRDRIAALNPVAARLLAATEGLRAGAQRSAVAVLAATAIGEQSLVQLMLDGLSIACLIQHIAIDGQGSLLIIQTDAQAAVAQLARHTRQLREVTVAISSTLDISTILKRVAQLMTELIGADAGNIPLYNAERDCLMPGRLINLPSDVVAYPFFRGSGIIWELIDRGGSVIINDYQDQPHALPGMIALGVTAVLAVPLRSPEQILGVLILYQCTPSKGFSQHDRELLEIIGQQTSIALQNAQLYENALYDSERRRTLYAASVEIGSALDLHELCETIHRSIDRLMLCDSCAIGLYDEARNEIEYVYIVDSQGRWPSHRVPVSRGMLGYVVREGLSLRISGSDPAIEALFGAERLYSAADHTNAILAAPLRAGEQTVGAFTVQAVNPHAYTSDDLDNLEMLAATAAIAIQNARLFGQIQQMATIDPLTQVPNRRFFFSQAIREIERANRYGTPISLIMLDADHFKSINDTYGHLAGDQVLQAIAGRCKENLRDLDTVARYGGEEFVILLPQTGYDQAMYVAQRLCQRIGQHPIDSDAGPISVSASLGVTALDYRRPVSLERLLDQADQALYAAKHAGRNRVRGFYSALSDLAATP